MRLADVDLNLLVYLDALLAEGHVTNAGLRLGMSQSATSRALKRLRELFDDELLVKSHHGMSLTPLAEHLQPQVRQTLTNLERLIYANDPFDPTHDHTTLSISADDWAHLIWVPALVAHLQSLAPVAQLKVIARTPSAPQTPHVHLGFNAGPHNWDTYTGKGVAWVGVAPQTQTSLTPAEFFDWGTIGFTDTCACFEGWQQIIPEMYEHPLVLEDLAHLPALCKHTNFNAIVPQPVGTWLMKSHKMQTIELEGAGTLSPALSWPKFAQPTSHAQLWLQQTVKAWFDAFVLDKRGDESPLPMDQEIA